MPRFSALLFAIRHRLYLLCLHFDFLQNACNLSHKERFDSKFKSIGNQQNGSPFVIRLENHSLLFPNEIRKIVVFPSASSVLIFFLVYLMFSVFCFFKEQFDTRKTSRNVYSFGMKMRLLSLCEALMSRNVTTLSFL